MRMIIAIIALTFSLSSAAIADGPPPYIKDTFPEHAMMKMLESWGAVKGEGASIDAKTRELIALGVAAQIPCDYCVYAHRARLRKMGATEAELKEAVVIAGYIRLFSTVFNGNDYSFDDFKTEFDSALNAAN